jgi:hypothetical protein
MAPALRKAKTVAGANLVLRNATVDDAEFILSLRLDPDKSRHLARTSPRLEDQVAWLRSYEQATDQAYFVVCDRLGKAIGCVRLYEPIGQSYCWGSWLMVRGLSPLAAIEANLLVYAYGRWLGFTEVRLDVRRHNSAVWKFHERFAGATRVDESELDFFYVVRSEQVERLLDKYRHLLSDPLAVVPLQG